MQLKMDKVTKKRLNLFFCSIKRLGFVTFQLFKSFLKLHFWIFCQISMKASSPNSILQSVPEIIV